MRRGVLRPGQKHRPVATGVPRGLDGRTNDLLADAGSPKRFVNDDILDDRIRGS